MNLITTHHTYYIYFLLGLFLKPISFSATEVLQKTDNISTLLATCQNGNSQQVYTAIKKLEKYTSSKYDQVSRDFLSKIILENIPHRSKLIKLAGFLELKESLYILIENNKLNKKDKKATNLALVRAGDEAKLKTLMKNVRKIPVDDAFVYDLLPSIIYVRKKEAFDYLLELILESKKDCHYPDAEIEGKISCAYKLMEEIAPYIIDFPVKVDKYGIEGGDYKKSLKIVQKWISKNIDTYQLVHDRL